MKTHLGNYSWQEVQELIKDDPVVVLPVGAFANISDLNS